MQGGDRSRKLFCGHNMTGNIKCIVVSVNTETAALDMPHRHSNRNYPAETPATFLQRVSMPRRMAPTGRYKSAARDWRARPIVEDNDVPHRFCVLNNDAKLLFCMKIIIESNELYKGELSGVWIIEPRRITDSRGYFCETFRADEFRRIVGPVDFVQENGSSLFTESYAVSIIRQEPHHRPNLSASAPAQHSRCCRRPPTLLSHIRTLHAHKT